MSTSSITKSLDRFEEYHEMILPNKVYLVSDSKGRYLSSQQERRDNLVIFSKSGAKIGDEDLFTRLHRQIIGKTSPVVLVWLGTCDLTKFSDRVRRKLVINPFDRDYLKDKLSVLRSDILHSNPDARVLFLHCPYYSIFTWNKEHGREDEEDKAQDSILQDNIDSFNSIVDDLNNGTRGPKFSLDLLKSTKTKKGKKSKYFYNYEALYQDGIHPCPNLAKLWLLRLKKTVVELLSD